MILGILGVKNNVYFKILSKKEYDEISICELFLKLFHRIMINLHLIIQYFTFNFYIIVYLEKKKIDCIWTKKLQMKFRIYTKKSNK